MTLYRGTMRLAIDRNGAPLYKWSNVWYVESPNPGVAAEQLAAFWLDVAPAYRPNVFCYEIYVTDRNATTDHYTILPIPLGQQRGTYGSAITGDILYNPNVCAALTINVIGSRPSRKFIRAGFSEGDIADNGRRLDPEFADRIRTFYNTAIANRNGSLGDPDGQQLLPFTSLKLTTRRLGKQAFIDLPAGPAMG